MACRRPSRAEIRSDPAAPTASANAAPKVEGFEAFIAEGAALAHAGGYEVTLVWARASCADAKGRLAITCSGKTWSGTPVFGMNAPGFIPTTGFFSAEWSRTRDGKSDRFGVTAFGGERWTQTIAGPPSTYRNGPTCTLAQAIARAEWSTHAPFKIVFEAGDASFGAEWRFVRDDAEKSVKDECSEGAPPTRP